MKKIYKAPILEIEQYELDGNIASNCGIVVSNGPALGAHEQCDNYEDPFDISAYSVPTRGPYNVQFYEDTNCDCYTTGGDYGYWTS